MIIARPTIEGVIASAAFENVISGATIEVVVAGQSLGAVVSWGAGEQVVGGRTYVEISHWCGGQGNEVLAVAAAIEEGHLNPQNPAHLRLGGCEGGAVGAHHCPGHAVVGGHFPGVGEDAQAIGVADRGRVDGDRHPFRGRVVADAGETYGGARSGGSGDVSINEAQDLNPPECIDAVIAQQCAELGAVVGNGQAVVCIAQHRVISLPAAEYGDVNAGRALAYLAHDFELRGAYGAGDQAALIGINRAGIFGAAVKIGQHDAGIEIDIAVDDVIAAAAFDRVRATATEQDVALGEYGYTPQQWGQATDHCHAGGIQHVVVDLQRIRGQPSLENVVAVPAGEALHFHEAVEEIDRKIGR